MPVNLFQQDFEIQQSGHEENFPAWVLKSLQTAHERV
jgi:hypothetical protein